MGRTTTFHVQLTARRVSFNNIKQTDQKLHRQEWERIIERLVQKEMIFSPVNWRTCLWILRLICHWEKFFFLADAWLSLNSGFNRQAASKYNGHRNWTRNEEITQIMFRLIMWNLTCLSPVFPRPPRAQTRVKTSVLKSCDRIRQDTEIMRTDSKWFTSPKPVRTGKRRKWDGESVDSSYTKGR